MPCSRSTHSSARRKTSPAAISIPVRWKPFRLEGKQYAVPFGVDPWVMFYNKDLFDHYTVAYPQPGWDWTDFLAQAQALRHPEDSIYGYAS